jgi:hypothetical protein
MALAIRTDFGSEGGALIKALCTGVVSSSMSSPTPTPTAQPTAPTSATPIARHNHIGAIVGGVVGGVAGLALTATDIFHPLKVQEEARSKESYYGTRAHLGKREGTLALDDDRRYSDRRH